jgi:exonuclease SbcC
VLHADRKKISSELTLEEAELLQAACEGESDRLDALAEEVSTAEADQEALQEAATTAEGHLTQVRSELARVEAELKSEKKALEVRTKAFVKAHGSLEDFSFDGEAFEAFLQAVDEFLLASEARATAQRALTQSEDLFKEHLQTHGVETAKELRGLLLSSEDIAEERQLLSDQRAERTRVLSAIADFEAAGPPTERPSPQASRLLHEEAKDRFTAILSTSTLLNNCGDQISAELKAIAGNEELIARTLKEYQDTNSLFRMCAGQTSGSNDMKVSLEDWVLSYYFKQVLAQANLRLSKMTNGRYSLLVNSSGGDARGRHGLDVEVDDLHTGRARSARTLSGGETFMSALALALGLADVVAGRNHELQALFIDEGFGSLDERSLDQVLTILEGLQDGGRVVGVISHVEELKRILPQGIEVEGTESGSRVTLHYPGE